MADRSIRTRLLVTMALLICATVLLRAASRRESVAPRQPFKAMPMALGEWHAVDAPLTQHIIEAAGVDDYLNRFYTDAVGNQVEIYVGYYKSQRAGDLIHSPRNCLPGAGWETERAARSTIAIPGRSPIVVNDFLMIKGLSRDVVLYWYEGRGRSTGMRAAGGRSQVNTPPSSGWLPTRSPAIAPMQPWCESSSRSRAAKPRPGRAASPLSGPSTPISMISYQTSLRNVGQVLNLRPIFNRPAGVLTVAQALACASLFHGHECTRMHTNKSSVFIRVYSCSFVAKRFLQSLEQ